VDSFAPVRSEVIGLGEVDTLSGTNSYLAALKTSFIAWDMVRSFLKIIKLSHVEKQGAWELSQELACSFVFLSAFETPSRLPNVWSNYSANTLDRWFYEFSAIDLVSLNVRSDTPSISSKTNALCNDLRFR
jgi:hypothetical protein